jgi:DnaJ-class molecular chaperone
MDVKTLAFPVKICPTCKGQKFIMIADGYDCKKCDTCKGEGQVVFIPLHLFSQPL